MDDSTYKGVYVYSPDAVETGLRSGEVGSLFLEGRRAYDKDFDDKTVQHVWADFDAFRRAQAGGCAGGVGRKALVR